MVLIESTAIIFDDQRDFLRTSLRAGGEAILVVRRAQLAEQGLEGIDNSDTPVLDHAFFRLSADKFQQFTAMLDAPPSHNPGLERLMAVAAPWATVKA